MSTTASPSVGVSTWNIDPTHTSVVFSVKHLMIATVKGQFGDVTGSVRIDEENPTAPNVEVEIAAGSIDTRTEQRDAHLRSADFLDVATHPTIRFVGRHVEGDLEGEFRLVGDLTIKGVTREVVLDVEHEGRARDPWGGERAVFSARGKFNRGDFGLSWNQALETGGVLVSEEVKLTIDAQLVRA